MHVVISVRDGQANVWGDEYVKAQPQARAQVIMPSQPNVTQIVDTIDKALLLAGTQGVVIFNIGHGSAAAAQCTGGACPLPQRGTGGVNPELAEGTVEIGPGGAMRLGGHQVKDVFVDVFYDFNVTGPPGFSDQDNDRKFNQNSPEAKKRQANWAVYQSICALFKRTKPYKVVLLTCNVGQAPLFLKKIANDWGTVVEAFTSKVQLTPQPNSHVRIHLATDPAGTGTNIPNSESELPLATGSNSVRVGPPPSP